jgi:Mrp family chromosome partitioning ATPase
MSRVTEDNIRDALRSVKDPEIGRNLVDLGMVRAIQVAGDKVDAQIALTTMACPLKGSIRDDVLHAIQSVPGVSEAKVELVAMTEEERSRAFGRPSSKPSMARQANKIGKVVAVMSGKGGVGKSFVSAVLATSLRRRGQRVGIMDADITGPSVPKMFGLQDRPLPGPFGIQPVCTRSGIAVMSINLFLEREDDAVVWRGPMVAGAIKQFWADVYWGELDYLIVDLPPGTSDAPLTVMQTLPLAGVVVVSSPQDLAGMVVRKAISLTTTLNVPIIGVVENMSFFTCPDNGKDYELFGPSHGDELARAAGAPLLAKLPVDPQASRLGDEGKIEDYRAKAVDDLGNAFLEALGAPIRA